MFTKNKKTTVDLIDFSITHIGTGQIGSYIINFLYNELEFRHIGYRIENNNGKQRCILYTINPSNESLEQYFKDRCSGMIEEKVQSMEGIPHSFNKWENGFEEVIPYENA